VVSQAGAVLLLETVRKTGLDQAISAALTPWRKLRAVHDPGKALLDLALAVALGGDCLADVAMLRCEPAVFGPVASDPTVSRRIDTLAASGEQALQAIRSGHRRPRRRPRDRPLRQAGRGRDLEEDLRPSPADGLRRPRPGRNRRARRRSSQTKVRDGAWVAELTGSLLDGWPKGMRLIVRKERPHPGAQLRITDADGMRITCFATNTPDRPIAELELRHRLRARAEDRIRAARSTGLRNLPLHHTAQNKIWLEIVQIALDLLAWIPMLALTGQARLWEPRRLRFRLFSAAAQLVTTGRRRILRLARHWPWTGEITGALKRLALLPNPG
jgi:hypothetical protein